jgi:surfactin synthase thioesterase subunit
MSLFFDPPTPAASRLFAFPHAGGADLEPRRWATQSPRQVVPVLLPGRGRRRAERNYRAMEPLVADLADALPDDAPFAFYGHSFGSWVAWELTRELRRRGRPGPTHLVLGARGAPGRPATTPLANLPLAAFAEAVQARYGGIPAELMDRPDVLGLFLPPLRSDIRILERWQPVDEPPLDLPLLVLHARGDRSVNADDLAAWSLTTTGTTTFREVDGGHFFHRDLDIPALIP